MSNLIAQLNQIKVDLSNGSEKLLTLIKSIIDNNNQSDLKEAFTYLSNYSVSPFITSDSVKISLDYVKSIKTEKEKIELMIPILVYIYMFDNLSTQYSTDKEEFINNCKKSNLYSELLQYYQKCEEKKPFDFNNHTPQERLIYSFTIGEVCIKSGDKDNADKWNSIIHDNFTKGATTYELKMRYYEFKANLGVLTNKFKEASRYFFNIYAENKDKQEANEYFRKSAVYAILSDDVDKNIQISNLLVEDKMRSLPIFKLLERMIKDNFISANEIPEFKKYLCNEIGYSDEYLNLIVLHQNIKIISSYFSSVSFERISQITGEKIDTVLDYLQELINSNAVKLHVNQPKKMIFFKPSIGEDQRKDDSIEKFCRELRQFTSSIPV